MALMPFDTISGQIIEQLYNLGLSWLQVSIYLKLDQLQNLYKKPVNVSNQKLATQFNVSVSTIKGTIKELETLKLITIDLSNYNSNHTKRLIKVIGVSQYNINAQINGIVAYINKLCNDNEENSGYFDAKDTKLRTQISQAIKKYGGTSSSLINFIKENIDTFNNPDFVQSWLDENFGVG